MRKEEKDMVYPMARAYRTPGGSLYEPFVELSEKPHLLIAGATGSGKSVALNGIIHSLLLTQSPLNARFVLIDPKKVELVQYSHLPHTARYASELPDIVRALQWAVDETDRRFSMMQRAGSREFSGPHLYVIIDELADLMVTVRKESLPLLQRQPEHSGPDHSNPAEMQLQHDPRPPDGERTAVPVPYLGDRL